ncbi:hypothetical protein PC120_g26211 [Phytophthora cactorum]|nr:hypothetical protein PC120_g26211 [Phytophthora cactorum]
MVDQSLAEQGGTYGVQDTLVNETVFMTKTRMGDTTDMADQRAVPMSFAITSMRLPIHQSTRYVLRLFSEAYTHFAVTIGTAGSDFKRSDFKTPHVDPTDISMMTNTDMTIHVTSTTEHGVQKTTIKYAKHDASSANRNSGTKKNMKTTSSHDITTSCRSLMRTGSSVRHRCVRFDGIAWRYPSYACGFISLTKRVFGSDLDDFRTA